MLDKTDPKRVYQALNKEAAESALNELEEIWGEKYPIVIQSWRKKWDNLSVYFRYPEAIRKVIIQLIQLRQFIVSSAN